MEKNWKTTEWWYQVLIAQWWMFNKIQTKTKTGGRWEYIVTWWLTETRRWEWYSPPPVELTLSRSQKVTVRRECGSRRCSHLSDLGSPDIGRGKRKWSQMIGGDPKRKWGSLPLSGSKYKKVFLSNARGRRTIAILLRAKDKRLRHEGLQNPFKPVLKTEQSLLAREKRKILQWNPVKKIR